MGQQLPTAGKANVQEAAREQFNRMLDERTAEGIAKYGTPLQTWNGRSAHKDLAEELIDAIQYAKQAEMERVDLELRIAQLESDLDGARALTASMTRRIAYLEAENTGLAERLQRGGG